MLPGNINPKKMKQMMKQMGMEMDQIPDIERVVIYTSQGNYVFDEAEVVAMTMQGVTTYQLTGTPRLEAAVPDIPDEDVTLVASQTGATPEDARAALVEARGDIAEAILKLSQQ